MTEEEFETFRLEVRKYRDKFVAHLDELNQMDIPKLQPVIDSVKFLYARLRHVDDDIGALDDAPPSATTYYRESLQAAKSEHSA
jgi:hypothetical protein